MAEVPHIAEESPAAVPQNQPDATDPSPRPEDEQFSSQLLAETLLDEMTMGSLELTADIQADGANPTAAHTEPLTVVPAIVAMRTDLDRADRSQGGAATDGTGSGLTADADPVSASLTLPAAPATMPLGEAADFRVLQTEIAALYGEVRELLTPRQEAARRARALLSEASILLKSQPDQLPPVQEKVQAVRSILRQAQVSRRWADVYNIRLLVYLCAWLLLGLAGPFTLFNSGMGDFSASPWLPFLITLSCGLIGGVLHAVHALWWHVSKVQDFDHRYRNSYLLRPLTGALVGGLLYLPFGLAFHLLALDPTANLLLGLIPYLLALFAGYSHATLLRRRLSRRTHSQAAA